MNEVAKVTARQLRMLGIPIPEEIPGEAWIPQDSYRMQTADSRMNPPEVGAGRLLVRMTASFREPFRYQNTRFVVDRQGNIVKEDCDDGDAREGSQPGEPT